jgi:hypothetical protein
MMFKRLITFFIIISFILSYYQPVFGSTPLTTGAQDFSVNQLPVPGTMVGESAPFAPLALKGLVINLQKPLEFQFIVDTGSSSVIASEGPYTGHSQLLRNQSLSTVIPAPSAGSSNQPKPPKGQAGIHNQEQLKQQANQLVKYFLAGLTIPEGDLWVNLSPYEKNRMVPEALGQTDLGRDLLAQDYILKQLTASLIYPEKDLGKEFWSRVYVRAQQQFGTTNIPVNTFNKVWILPDQAQVFEHGAAAYVTKATLKVMLDEDYLALSHRVIPTSSTVIPTSSTVIPASSTVIPASSTVIPAKAGIQTHSLASNIIRQIILPEITKEVNTGKNFAPLRQIYQALILAKWYKETIQNGLLDAIYTNKNKVVGVNLTDPAVKEQIYERYLKAYKKGVFNYIKEDPINVSLRGGPADEAISTRTTVARKYFSGGAYFAGDFPIGRTHDGAMVVSPEGKTVELDVSLQDAAMAGNNEDEKYIIAYTEDKVSWDRAVDLMHKALEDGRNLIGLLAINSKKEVLLSIGDSDFEQGHNRLNSYIKKYDGEKWDFVYLMKAYDHEKRATVFDLIPPTGNEEHYTSSYYKFHELSEGNFETKPDHFGIQRDELILTARLIQEASSRVSGPESQNYQSIKIGVIGDIFTRLEEFSIRERQKYDTLKISDIAGLPLSTEKSVSSGAKKEGKTENGSREGAGDEEMTTAERNHYRDAWNLYISIWESYMDFQKSRKWDRMYGSNFLHVLGNLQLGYFDFQRDFANGRYEALKDDIATMRKTFADYSDSRNLPQLKESAEKKVEVLRERLSENGWTIEAYEEWWKRIAENKASPEDRELLKDKSFGPNRGEFLALFIHKGYLTPELMADLGKVLAQTDRVLPRILASIEAAARARASDRAMTAKEDNNAWLAQFPTDENKWKGILIPSSRILRMLTRALHNSSNVYGRLFEPVLDVLLNGINSIILEDNSRRFVEEFVSLKSLLANEVELVTTLRDVKKYRRFVMARTGRKKTLVDLKFFEGDVEICQKELKDFELHYFRLVSLVNALASSQGVAKEELIAVDPAMEAKADRAMITDAEKKENSKHMIAYTENKVTWGKAIGLMRRALNDGRDFDVWIAINKEREILLSISDSELKGGHATSIGYLNGQQSDDFNRLVEYYDKKKQAKIFVLIPPPSQIRLSDSYYKFRGISKTNFSTRLDLFKIMRDELILTARLIQEAGKPVSPTKAGKSNKLLVGVIESEAFGDDEREGIREKMIHETLKISDIAGLPLSTEKSVSSTAKKEGEAKNGPGDEAMMTHGVVLINKADLHGIAVKVLNLKKDRAQLADSRNGGIDLNKINVKRTGKTINVQFDQAQLIELEQSNFKGFIPVITGFRYIQSPYPLLGINNPAKEPEELVKA